jgi:DMSO/TMAO reductase YedYZ molybdopterin-dependent catalytic subunit
MSNLLTRRKLITTGLTTIAGASGLAMAARIANRYGLIPPDHGGIYGVGETLTYAAQRILTAHHPLAREFSRSEISKVVPVNGLPPVTDNYQQMLRSKFADWKLSIDGLVARPMTFSLTQLKQFPMRSQITHQACEEGWSFIAEWTGVPLSHVLSLAGVRPEAKYVVYHSIDPGWWDSIDMADAWHPQTLIAYGMNGRELPTGNGAPLRMRVARQLGYKSVKFLSRISVVDSVADLGDGQGSPSPAAGYSWYAGI